jgi:dTDP-3-amino-3,4,6-trideoxy-alpha-D-glucose transaminase
MCGYCQTVEIDPVASAASLVPFYDLRPSHEPLKDGVTAAFADLVDTGAFTNGPQVRAFEEAFAAYAGTALCVGLASGLDALRLALIAAEVGRGDEVLVPANTFIATFEAVGQAGAIPVPVEVSEADLNLDMPALEAAITPHTRAMVPVHLYGQLADMRAVARIASDRDLLVVEDACQAHGAARDGLRAGTTGIAGAFSFYPGKNLGAFGDAGALVSEDSSLVERVRLLREHGQREKYLHEVEGFTARLDTVQALVLLHKLPLLDRWNRQRAAAAAAYGERLGDVGDLKLPSVPHGSEPAWHLYVVRSGHRDALAFHLRERGIGTGLHYPQPPHLSPAYASLGYPRGSFPVAERLADEVLSLPLFPGITESQLDTVCAAVEGFFACER